jgi:putative CocE/NonD family hydrolase
MIRTLLAATAIAAIATSLPAQTKPAPQSKAAQAKALKEFDERPAKYVPAVEKYGYIRRVVDIPMRDGVKLHTIIAIPRGVKDVGMLMTRTPYDAESSASDRPGIYASLPGAAATGEDAITASGYIRVFQDVRGMHGSEGQYSMNPAPVGTPFNPTRTDDSTDTYDTIDWLVKNVPESNKRVGIIGISYDGFLSLMPLINPHPALKVAVPMNPMVDGWRGDDWFHNGAFRQTMMGYMLGQEATRDASAEWIQDVSDDYDWYLKGGSAGDIAKKQGLEQVGFWRKVAAHPSYDTYWQSQAMDQVLAKQPLKVPVMVVHSLWDQEDIYGAPAVYKALEAKDTKNDMVFLTMGPWFHGQGAGDGSALGGVKWSADTALWWRRNVLAPFLAHYLKSDQPAMDVAPVTAFQSGANEWQRLQGWPAAGAAAPAKLYLKPAGGLGFDAATGGAATAQYISDPAAPVGYRARPLPKSDSGNGWRNWLGGDQRMVSGRPDVLVFQTEPLTQAVTVAGVPEVNLNAATTGTDSDWVVKLIDVYPDGRTGDAEMAGYQFGVAMDIFRGRYRESLSEAKPIAANAPLTYRFALPTTNHVFRPGHRIMVQVQSSWFPLYDRNPQTFVPNIMFAKPADYVKATQTVTVGGPDESFVTLPVVR